MAVNYRRNIVTFTEVARRRATSAAYGTNLPQLIRGANPDSASDDRVDTHELALFSNRNAGESFFKSVLALEKPTGYKLMPYYTRCQSEA